MSTHVLVEVHCDAPDCKHSTMATALARMGIAPLGGLVDYCAVRFPTDPMGNATGWTHDESGAKCPEHAGGRA